MITTTEQEEENFYQKLEKTRTIQEVIDLTKDLGDDDKEDATDIRNHDGDDEEDAGNIGNDGNGGNDDVPEDEADDKEEDGKKKHIKSKKGNLDVTVFFFCPQGNHFCH